MPIEKAIRSDIPALVELVNSAYRGDTSRKGWTTEAHLLEGNLRTDAASVEHLFESNDNCILKFPLDDGIIAGCVYLQKQDKKLYLGMLSVNPELQAGGIGKQLLQAAEEYAKQIGCNKITMTVISVRTELIAWYMRRGYHFTGDNQPFPTDNRYGIPTQELVFEVLEKEIN